MVVMMLFFNLLTIIIHQMNDWYKLFIIFVQGLVFVKCGCAKSLDSYPCFLVKFIFVCFA